MGSRSEQKWRRSRQFLRVKRREERGCSLDLEKIDQNAAIYEPFKKFMEHLGKSGSSEVHPDSPILYLPIHVSFICGHSQFFPKSFQQQQKVAPPLLTSCGRHSHAVFYYIFCCLKAEALLNGKCRVVRRDGKSVLAANTLSGEMHINYNSSSFRDASLTNSFQRLPRLVLAQQRDFCEAKGAFHLTMTLVDLRDYYGLCNCN